MNSKAAPAPVRPAERALALETVFFPKSRRGTGKSTRAVISRWPALVFGWLWLETAQGYESTEITRLGLTEALHGDRATVAHSIDLLKEHKLIHVVSASRGGATSRTVYSISVETDPKVLGACFEMEDGRMQGEFIALPAPNGKDALSSVTDALIWGYLWLNTNYGREPMIAHPADCGRVFGLNASKMREYLTRLEVRDLLEWKELSLDGRGEIKITLTRDMAILEKAWRTR